MDRSVLEGNPHSVIEGMIIAAFAIGATTGGRGLRLRASRVPFAVERLRRALQVARERGLLGRTSSTPASTSTSASTRAPRLRVRRVHRPDRVDRGNAACPAQAHPHVAHGLYGQPTNLNNVESYANVPWIVLHGAEAFSARARHLEGHQDLLADRQDRERRPRRGADGRHLRHVIFDIGGGMLPGRHFKAVQSRPVGGCLPEALLDEPIDFESLVAAGSMMGSGGMVVVDDTTCMVDFARFFLKFTAEESCGKCVPCRVGSQRLLEILERITAGEGELKDIERLEQLSADIIEGSLCALGGSAPYRCCRPSATSATRSRPTSSTNAVRPKSAGR